MPTLAIFQLYHGKNKLIFNEKMMRSASLSWIFSASSLKQQSADRHVVPTRTHPDSKPTSQSWMLCA